MHDSHEPSTLVTCQACGHTLALHLRAVPAALRAWRTFVCPVCRVQNFVRLAAEILTVEAGEPNA
jgi:hypothetical protein